MQLKSRSEDLEAGATSVGWKAGFGTVAAMENLGTSGPLVGYLTDRTLLPSGATVEVDGWGKPVLEPEVALRLGRDLPADADPIAVAAAIDGVGAAIELVDLGNVGDDAGQILVGNVFHRHYLLGDLRPVADRAALDAVRIDVFADGHEMAIGADPADVLGDLAGVVSGLARLLAAGGVAIQAGEVIITGAAVPPIVVSGGEQVEVLVADSRVAVAVA